MEANIQYNSKNTRSEVGCIQYDIFSSFILSFFFKKITMVALVWFNPYSIRTCVKLFHTPEQTNPDKDRVGQWRDRPKKWVKNRALCCRQRNLVNIGKEWNYTRHR